MKKDNLRITRRTFVAEITAGGLSLMANRSVVAAAQKRRIVLENRFLRVDFSAKTGSMIQVVNKLTGELIAISGDIFEITANSFSLISSGLFLKSVRKKTSESVEAIYDNGKQQVMSVYQLGSEDHFLEKTITLTSVSAFQLHSLIVSSVRLSGNNLRFVKYPYQKNVVFFARSNAGEPLSD